MPRVLFDDGLHCGHRCLHHEGRLSDGDAVFAVRQLVNEPLEAALERNSRQWTGTSSTVVRHCGEM
jgi:hypothetical protein